MSLGSTLAIEQNERAKRMFSPRGMALGTGRKNVSPRLIQLRDWVALGLTNKEIAPRMGISEGTVKVYVSDLMRLSKKSRKEIIRDHKVIEAAEADGLPRMGAFE